MGGQGGLFGGYRGEGVTARLHNLKGRGFFQKTREGRQSFGHQQEASSVTTGTRKISPQ